MKTLIPMDNYGVFADMHDTARANSLMVAEMFEKRHDNVLNSIRSILQEDDEDGFNALNFKEIKYVDDRGRKKPAYAMTRDGFTLLAMGFTGKKAICRYGARFVFRPETDILQGRTAGKKG